MGALTAGRRTPDLALFPYYTEDKIHDSAEVTRSQTILIVEERGRHRLWEPFSDRYRGLYQIERNLYKTGLGDTLIFEMSAASFGEPGSFQWAVGCECDPVTIPEEKHKVVLMVDYTPDHGYASWPAQ